MSWRGKKVPLIPKLSQQQHYQIISLAKRLEGKELWSVQR